MTTKDTTLRRCVGSTRFGIETHEAPVSDFPKQPSQKDGLGRMCQEHWSTYTSGLRKDALARKAGEAGDEAQTKPRAAGRTATTPKGPAPRAEGPAKPSPKAAEVEEAEILIAVVDAMPATEMVKRVGDADVQAALEVSAAARMLAD